MIKLPFSAGVLSIGICTTKRRNVHRQRNGTWHKTGTWLNIFVFSDIATSGRIDFLRRSPGLQITPCARASSALDKHCIGEANDDRRIIVLDDHFAFGQEYIEAPLESLQQNHSALPQGGRRTIRILHWVRDPLTLILSAHEYHRRTSESWIVGAASRSIIEAFLRDCSTGRGPECCANASLLRQARASGGYQELLRSLSCV